MSKKMSFSKFVPDSNEFVVAKATAKAMDDFMAELTVFDGQNKVEFFFSEYSKQSRVNFLKDLIRGAQQVLDFYDSISRLPKTATPKFDWVKELNVYEPKPDAKKKPAAKKSSKK